MTTKWKYFEHTGALITADGSGDDLFKFDGNPLKDMMNATGWSERKKMPV